MKKNRVLKPQQRTVGAIVKIPLEDGFHTYARILEVRCAFYDARSREELSAEEIIGKPVLFFASVYDRVITRGYWPKIGKKTAFGASFAGFAAGLSARCVESEPLLDS